MTFSGQDSSTKSKNPTTQRSDIIRLKRLPICRTQHRCPIHRSISVTEDEMHFSSNNNLAGIIV